MRVVSLVPSLTETLLALGFRAAGQDDADDGNLLVGRTPWCIHPAAARDVCVVGGTKTPNLNRLQRLQPDLVLLDREENRRETWQALTDAGIRCWVAEVTSVHDVPDMLQSLGQAVGCERESNALADALREALGRTAGEPGDAAPVAVPLIWHEPLMALSPARYGGSLLVHTGFRVPDLAPDSGYPPASPAQMGEAGVEVLLLTSEPHNFTEAEGEAIADAVAAAGFNRPDPVKVDGEALTWFGARSAGALDYWFGLRQRLAGPCVETDQ